MVRGQLGRKVAGRSPTRQIRLSMIFEMRTKAIFPFVTPSFDAVAKIVTEEARPRHVTGSKGLEACHLLRGTRTGWVCVCAVDDCVLVRASLSLFRCLSFLLCASKVAEEKGAWVRWPTSFSSSCLLLLAFVC